MSASSDTDDAAVPDAETCESLCNQFKTITKTDPICAQMFLQQNAWGLEAALNAFFQEMGVGVQIEKVQGAKGLSLNFDAAVNAGESSASSEEPATDHLSSIKVLSWNIDGLDTNNQTSRFNAVIKEIQSCSPDAVFLQEVTDISYSMLDDAMGSRYDILSSVRTGVEPYFTAVLLRKTRLSCRRQTVNSFGGTRMGRGMLKVEAVIEGDESVPVILITSHLESCKEHSEERIRQLKTCFDEISKTDDSKLVIFGGDLNLRDKEVDEAGGIPPGVVDVWEACGASKDTKYTWDCMKNDNVHFEKFKPRMRYDRIYAKLPRASNDGSGKWSPTAFSLVGLQRIRSCLCFPSDHFGMLTTFSRKLLRR